jgi:anti-sigma-K factor RskA
MSGQERDNEKIRPIVPDRCDFDQQGFPAAYALDALDGDDVALFRQHLADCAICRAAIAECQSTVAQFPLAIEPEDGLAPSPELRTRILAAVAEDLAAERDQTAEVSAPIPFPVRRRVPQAYAVAAVLLLALGLGLLGWNLNLQREVAQARAERDAARRELAVTRWQLSGVQAGQQINGEVLYLRDQQRAVVSVQGLPDLQPGQVYQIWLIQDGAAPRPETIFLSGTTAVQADLARFSTIAITIEPGPRGSAAPTSPVLVAGSLTQ